MSKHRSSTAHYLQTRNDVTAPQTKSRKKVWVVARSLCYYHCFSFAEIPAVRWQEVLKLKVKQWCPIDNYDYYCTWQGHHAMVWAWDKTQQEIKQKAEKIEHIAHYPETVLRDCQPANKKNSCTLVACIEGFEGQVWKNGVLYASRWWSTMPSQKQWQQFIRTQGGQDTTFPQETHFPFIEKSWGHQRAHAIPVFLYQERLWIILLFALLGSIAAWQAVTLWKWVDAEKKVRQDITKIENEAQEILAARNKALTNNQQVKMLQKLAPFPSQLTLLHTVIQLLPKDAIIVHWLYTLGKLELTIEAENTTPRFYVETFQNSLYFSDVSSAAGDRNKQLILTMQVKQ